MGLRSIYRKVAKEHGVSVAEVKRDMQEAIIAAYNDPLNQNEITRAYQRRVPSKDKIPTPDELIRYAASEAKKRKDRVN